MKNSNNSKQDKYLNKYRISSARLKNWDYGANGSYFNTICTAQMEHFFGEVINGEMILNDTGLLAQTYWYEISDRWPFLEYGNFTVMPNHIHGILIIDRNATMGGHAETRLIASLSNPPKKTGGFA